MTIKILDAGIAIKRTPKPKTSLSAQLEAFYNQCHTEAGESGGQFCPTNEEDKQIKATGPDKAFKELGAGNKVNVKKGNDIRAMLHKIADDKTTRTFDMCKIQVEGHSPFCNGNLGISRSDMPQLNGVPIKGSKADKLPKTDGTVSILQPFLYSLKKKGISSKTEKVKVTSLEPTQSEIDGRKAASFAVKKHLKTIIISKDNHVLDGHHHWAAGLANYLGGGDSKVNVIRIDATIKELLPIARDFDTEWGITSKALTASVLQWNALLAAGNPCHDEHGEFCSTITGDLSHLTPENQKTVQEQIQKIPSDVRRILTKYKVTVVSKDKVSRGKTTRGLDYGGIYNPNTHEVEVSNTGFSDIATHEKQGDANFVLHEFGHALDYALGRPSQHAAFRSLQKDANPKPGSYYHTPLSGTNPREEMLAETYAHVWQGTEPKDFTLTPSLRQIATELRHNINTGESLASHVTTLVASIELAGNPCHSPSSGEFCSTGLTDEHYALLSPNKPFNRMLKADTESQLMQTPNGAAFVKAIDNWANDIGIKDLRNNITKELRNRNGSDESRAVIGALRHSPVTSETLYRGMKTKEGHQALLAKYKPGSTVDINLSSYSTNHEVANAFASNGEGTGRNVMLVITGPHKAIPIQNLTSAKTTFKELEHITGGRFKVTSIDQQSLGSGGMFTVIQLHQEGTL